MSGSEQNGGGGGGDQESHPKVDVNREVEFLGYIDRTVFRLAN